MSFIYILLLFNFSQLFVITKVAFFLKKTLLDTSINLRILQTKMAHTHKTFLQIAHIVCFFPK
jgi:hypothetical protein